MEAVRDNGLGRPKPDAVAQGKAVVYKHARKATQLPATAQFSTSRTVRETVVLPPLSAAPSRLPNDRPQRAVVLRTARVLCRKPFARLVAAF